MLWRPGISHGSMEATMGRCVADALCDMRPACRVWAAGLGLASYTCC